MTAMLERPTDFESSTATATQSGHALDQLPEPHAPVTPNVSPARDQTSPAIDDVVSNNLLPEPSSLGHGPIATQMAHARESTSVDGQSSNVTQLVFTVNGTGCPPSNVVPAPSHPAPVGLLLGGGQSQCDTQKAAAAPDWLDVDDFFEWSTATPHTGSRSEHVGEWALDLFEESREAFLRERMNQFPATEDIRQPEDRYRDKALVGPLSTLTSEDFYEAVTETFYRLGGCVCSPHRGDFFDRYRRASALPLSYPSYPGAVW